MPTPSCSSRPAAMAIEHARDVRAAARGRGAAAHLDVRHAAQVPGLEVHGCYLPAQARNGIGAATARLRLRRPGRAGDRRRHGPRRRRRGADGPAADRCAWALDGHGPAAVVERLNTMLLSLDEASMTTPSSTAYRHRPAHAAAGQRRPRAAACRGAGRAAALPGADRRPAAGHRGRPALHRARVRACPGHPVVLVTDGAIERRDESIDAGLERLRGLVVAAPSPSALCRRHLRAGDPRRRPAVLTLRVGGD